MSSASLVSPRNQRGGGSNSPRSSVVEPAPSPRPLNAAPRREAPRGGSPFVRGGNNPRNNVNRPPLPVSATKISRTGPSAAPISPRDKGDETDLKSPKGGPSPLEEETGGSLARIAVPEVHSLEHAHATIKMLAAQADEARAEKAAIWEQARDDARAMAQVAKNIEGNQGGTLTTQNCPNPISQQPLRSATGRVHHPRARARTRTYAPPPTH